MDSTLFKLLAFEKIFNHKELLSIIIESGAFNIICGVAATVAVVTWSISILRPVMKGQFDFFSKEVLYSFFILVLIGMIFFVPQVYKNLGLLICNIFDSISDKVFSQAMTSMSIKMRTIYANLKNASSMGIDLFSLDFFSASVDMLIASVALIILFVVMYVFISYGIVFLLLAFIMGPVAMSLYFVRKEMFENWLSLMIGAASITPFVGLVLLSVDRNPFINELISATQSGSVIQIAVISIVTSLTLNMAMTIHATLFGVPAFGVPSRIFGILQFVGGNFMEGFNEFIKYGLKKLERLHTKKG